jgi:hypothetical protein
MVVANKAAMAKNDLADMKVPRKEKGKIAATIIGVK